MIDLTEQQSQALSSEGTPAKVRDPRTNEVYVLVPSDTYEHVRPVLEDEELEFVRGMYKPTMELFGREGWNDPSMDIYNDLDPRRQP